MAVFTNQNRAAWQAIADAASINRPSVNKRVEIVGGRKHKGKVGTVVFHGVNRYYDTRYCDEARMALMEINGREGYIVQVCTDAGDKFYVPAEYSKVVSEVIS